MRRGTDRRIGKRGLSSSTSPQNIGRSARFDGSLATVQDARPITAATKTPSASIPQAQPLARLARMRATGLLCQQVDKESRRGETHKNSEADFESTLRKDMGETDSERREETGNGRNHHNTDQGYEA
jgi:hypothetical protein